MSRTTNRRAPYIFVNFGDWRRKSVKLNIWSEGLKLLSKTPDATWVGRWVSVSGLMEPPYSNPTYGYTSLFIIINQPNQIHLLTELEAQYRLAAGPAQAAPIRNTEILGNMGGRSPPSVTPRSVSVAATSSANQQVVDQMRRTTTPAPSLPSHYRQPMQPTAAQLAAAKAAPGKAATKSWLGGLIGALFKRLF